MKNNNLPKPIHINGRLVGPEYPPYVIAEISGNHNGNIERALQLIEMAKKAGANAVKIQTYTPDTMTIDCDKSDFKVKGGLWDGKSLYELYDWAHTPWEWHPALFEKAKEVGVTLFSSPFDESAIDFLETLEAPAYKIASFEMTDLPLVEKAAKTGKPLIVSTGMATEQEIEETVDIIRATGNEQFALLHCVSSYPAKHSEANLKTIPDLANRFDCLVGLSDHTLTNTTSVSSVALGACIIEKHFIDSRAEEGPDSAFSIEPSELTSLCEDAKVAWECLGRVNYVPTDGEKGSLVFRRSLYVTEDMRAGDVFTTVNLRRIRPGFGMAPKNYDSVLGKRASQNISRGTPLQPELIEQT